MIEIARRLFDAGRRVAVVSRGYRADRDGLADELLLVSARLLHVVCVQDPDRVAAARRVIADHRIDAIVLDDAFQHRRLARDLDVVTLDATRPFGFDHLLPRGLLREPPSALRRAGLIVITRADQVDGTAMKALRTRVGRLAPGVHCIACRHLVVGLSRMAGDPPSLPELVGCKVVCFSGVGNPVAFERTVAGLGAEVRSHLVFSDHHRYRPADLRRVAARVAQTGAEMALTTEKDAVKLASVAFAWPCPAAAVRVDLDFLNGGSATLQKALDQAIAKHQCP